MVLLIWEGGGLYGPRVTVACRSHSGTLVHVYSVICFYKIQISRILEHVATKFENIQQSSFFIRSSIPDLYVLYEIRYNVALTY